MSGLERGYEAAYERRGERWRATVTLRPVTVGFALEYAEGPAELVGRTGWCTSEWHAWDRARRLAAQHSHDRAWRALRPDLYPASVGAVSRHAVLAARRAG